MPTLTLDRAAVEPGDAITGSVAWTGAATTVSVSLRWETRGKGDQDTQVATSTTIPASNGTVRFALTAPYQPFSFSGKLISIVYFVISSVDGVEARQEILIAPGGKEVVLASAG